VEAVLFERNIVRDTENGINILGYDGYAPSGQATRLTIRQNLVVTAGTFLMVGSEAGAILLDHNTVINGGTYIMLYKGDVWPAGTAAPRPAAFAVDNLTHTNSLGNHNDYGVFGEEVGIGQVALQLTRAWVWTNNVLAGGDGGSYSYPIQTWKPSAAEHAAEFANTTDYELAPTSAYRTRDTVGAALGWPGLLTPEPPQYTLTVEMTVTRCRFVLAANPPDATGGWRAQFRRGTTLFTNVGTIDATPPYTRSTTLPAGDYSFSVVWTKTGVPSITSAALAQACQ
jgi:hypothetical protein